MGYPARYRSTTASDWGNSGRRSTGGFQKPGTVANENFQATPDPVGDTYKGPQIDKRKQRAPKGKPSPARGRAAADWYAKRSGLRNALKANLRAMAAQGNFILAQSIYDLWRGRTLNQPVIGRTRGPKGMPASHGWFIEAGPCTAAGAPGAMLGRNDPYACVTTLTLTNTTYNNQLNSPSYTAAGGIYRMLAVANVRAAGASNKQMELVEKWRTVGSLAAGLYPAGSFSAYPYLPAQTVWPIEIPYPQFNPMTLPIQRPVVAPRSLPRPQRAMPINPFLSPVEQTIRGPLPVRAIPGQGPGPGIETHFPYSIKPYAKPLPPFRQPTAKKTKEKKLRSGLPPGKMAKALNGLTETADLIDALFYGLDKKTRGRAYWKGETTTPQERALVIFNNLDKMDWNKAFENIIENQAKDFAFGKLGRVTAKANRKSKVGVGLGTGGGSRRAIGVGSLPT